MLRRVGSHLRDQWMGALSLFLVLGGGTAYAVGTIGTEDIIDESVRSIDIRNGQIRSSDVRDDTWNGGGLGAPDLGPGSAGVSELDPLAFAAPDISQDSLTSPFEIADDAIQSAEVSDGSLTGADVASSSLTGSDVASDTLTGSDVDETTLTGLDGHDAYREVCDTPADNSFKTCLSVTFELGRPMSVLAIFGGAGSHSTDSFADTVFGECKTMLDGADKRGPWSVGYDLIYGIGLPTIIDVMGLSAGVHTVALACRESPTDVHFKNLSIGVVELRSD